MAKGGEAAYTLEGGRRNPRECAVAKCVHNTLYQCVCLSQPARMRCGKGKAKYLANCFLRRNPRECAVAKPQYILLKCFNDVATRANALWQRIHHSWSGDAFPSQPARMRCGKERIRHYNSARSWSQPARMRCGKVVCRSCTLHVLGRNPRECAVAKGGLVIVKPATLKSQPARMRCGKGSCTGTHATV